MPKTTQFTIGDYFADFIDRQVAQGRYGSESDVVQAGLRLLEEQEMKVDALRRALIEGEQSGRSVPFDFDEFIERKQRQHAPSK